LTGAVSGWSGPGHREALSRQVGAHERRDIPYQWAIAEYQNGVAKEGGTFYPTQHDITSSPPRDIEMTAF
jgi:hypothetical protein